MRRPVTFIFAAFAGGIWIGYYLAFWVAAVLWALLLLAAFLWRKHQTFIFLIVGVLGLCYFQAADSRWEPLHEYEGCIISVTGTILTVEDKEDYLRILIRSHVWQCGENSGTTGKKLLVNLSYLPGELGKDPSDLLKLQERLNLFGKEVRLKGKLTLPSGMRNPGLFDHKLYLKTRGITGIVNAGKAHLELTGRGNSAIAMTGKLKENFAASLDGYMGPDSKALLLGILFGDKNLIEEEIYEDFQRNGCAHILSVSGIHVSILYLYICMIFRNRRNPVGSACALGLVFFYAALADFSPSVVRAVLMIAIHILSKYLHRKYDLLCCISFSALLMLLYNPYYLFSLGFQLSYLAVFTLAFALPVAESKIKKLKEYRRYQWLAIVLQAFAPIFVIQAGMAPVSAYHFQYFSLSAFFINLPVIVLAGLILPLGMGMVLLNDIGPGLFDFCATGADLLLQIMIQLNVFIGDLNISSVNATGPPIGMLMLYYGLFFFLASESFWILHREKNRRQILGVFLCILCLSVSVPFIMQEGERRADIVFLDVGQGDCLHLRTPAGKNILIDGGGSDSYDTGKNILLPYLLKNGVYEVDLAIVTHLHKDHYGGIASLCKRMPVKNLALYSANALKEEIILTDTGLSEKALLYVAAGDRIHVEEDIYIDVLYPSPRSGVTYERLIADAEDENHSSLVLRVHYRGLSLLVTGDMGFEGEQLLMEQSSHDVGAGLKADVLKVGHHGSRFSTGDDFLEAVNPRIAVVQVGRNNFGHPHPDVIEKLTKKSIMVYRNDQNGAILLYFNRKGIKLRTML